MKAVPPWRYGFHFFGRTPPPGSDAGRRKDPVHHFFCFFLYPLQMILPQEAFSVDLVHVLSSRRACGKPSVFRRHLQASYGSPVPRCSRKLCDYGLSRQGISLYRFRGKFLEQFFPLRRSRCVDPGVKGSSQP